MSSNSKPWRVVQASVIGPSHLRDNIPNQDAVKTKVWGDAVLAVVSDGVGSAKYSDRGSRAACEAVRDAVRYWIDNNGVEVSDLLKLIQTIWLIKIRPLSPIDCSATLLWALMLPGNKAILAQLGDGAILHYDGSKLNTVLTDNKEGFGNETVALRESGVLSKWRVSEIFLTGRSNSIMLMTDGISEDIETEDYEEFAQIVDIKLRGKRHASLGKKWLVNELKNWKTPHHSDDKTIAVLIQNGEL